MNGIVYLIHLDKPVAHAQHYIGFSDDLEARLEAHATSRWEELPEPCHTENGGTRRGRVIGDGNPLLAFANTLGITWRLARTWPGDRSFERRLKRYWEPSRRDKKSSRLCPFCSAGAHNRMRR